MRDRINYASNISDICMPLSSCNTLYPSDVAVIILNYKGADDTIACLRALYRLASPPGVVLVVDNASPDNSVKRILEAWRDWATPHLVRMGEEQRENTSSKAVLLELSNNSGYAAGNNAGIRFARKNTQCSAYWVLNNDTLPEPQALSALCSRYNTSKKYALVGSTLVFSSDGTTIQCAGGSKVYPALGLTESLHQGESIDRLSYILPEQVEAQLGAITGASMLIPERILHDIGIMREDFFLYFEDTEFSLRARKAGFPLLWARDSIVLHKEGGTTGAASAGNIYFQRPRWVDYLMLRNRACFVREFYPWALPFLCASYIIVACKRLLRKQPDRVGLVFRALWHGILGKMATQCKLFKI